LDELDRLVRRSDEDRWLASRFAPALARERMIALYAVHHEIVRSSEAAKESGLAAIRLAWWRDALQQIHAGGAPPQQPALVAYAEHARWFAGEEWLEILDARSDGPLASWEAAETHAVRTNGGLMRLALRACGEQAAQYLQPLAAAQGLVELCGAEARRPRLPGSIEEGLARAEDAYQRGRAASRGFTAGAFPAFGYVTLAPLHIRALRLGHGPPALLARQWRLVKAAATGRL
jgi:phytoene synthase